MNLKTEEFDMVIHEYIEFVNEQIGMYMDALAGYAGHCVRIERQVARILRASHKEGDVIVYASYVDPTRPDVIHNRIVRADDYIAANSKGGSNEQQHACAIIVFLYTYWEKETRPRLAKILNVDVGEIRSKVMGDLRLVRNAIIHTKRVFRQDDYKKLEILKDLFEPDKRIHLSYDSMHKIFGFVKNSLGGMLLTYYGGVENAPIDLAEIIDVAIPKRAL